MEDNQLSHFDGSGRAKMVDVGAKSVTARRAIVRGSIRISVDLAKKLAQGENEKGDAFTVAKTAGILAAKQTGLLIPMCHPLGLDHLGIELELDQANGKVWLEAVASTTAKTGVEMEAMMAATIAALTFYDMVKAMDKAVVIEKIGLYKKEGGKSGLYINSEFER